MSKEMLINFSTVLALAPITIFSLYQKREFNWTFWFLLCVSVIGPVTALLIKLSGSWLTDLGTSIWATIAMTMFLFALSALLLNEIWKLAPLVSGYMILLGITASLVSTDNVNTLREISSPWISLHIIFSITTYGLLTISAISAFGAAVQEHSLKAKILNPIYRLLPSITDCDNLMVRLLVISEIILGIGLLSGMAIGYLNYQTLFPLNHKSLLTLAAFIVIAILLITHFQIGIRGRRAARYVLTAYLLLTLAYLGVKFVTDIIIN